MERATLAEQLRRVVGAQAVVDDAAALMTYEADGCVMDLHAPNLVVLPNTTEQVAEVVRLARQHGAPIVPRGVALASKSRWIKRSNRRANVNRLNPGRKTDMGESSAVHGVEVEILPL